MRRAAAIIALTAGMAFAAIAAGCDTSTPAPQAVARSANARALGMFSTKLPSDMREQARGSLERDAFRRENRFVEATKPGFLFASTRIEESELSRGLWTPEEMFQLGAQLFHLTFTKRDGFGSGERSSLRRFHAGRRGGPDAYKCATCHWRGGIGGAGDGADERGEEAGDSAHAS